MDEKGGNNNKIKLAARLARKASMWEVHITVSFCTRNGIAMWGDCFGWVGVRPWDYCQPYVL